jgi:site-specific recombinase XerC
VHRWVDSIGLKSIFYGTHSMRRTKVTQIYRKTGNLRAVQLLLGHTKLESTVRYLGIEVDDALHIAGQIELEPSNPTYPRWSLARQKPDVP